MAANPVAAPERGAAANPYGARSDEELTALAADWDALDRHQRRALLTEMKLRMARQGDGKGVIHIRTERRYGRLIRQPDGRVIRIETQVVHVRPLAPGELPPADAPQGRHSFGVGFEQRVARRARGSSPDGDSSGTEGAGEGTPDAPVVGELFEDLETGPDALIRAPLPIYQVADPAP